MAALVLVKDASEDGGGVEIGNAIGFDLEWVRARRGSKLGGRTRTV